MHEHEQNRRIDAARAFAESLDQLQKILTQEAQAAEAESLTQSAKSSDSRKILQAWEDAAADLDQFFGDTQPLGEEEES